MWILYTYNALQEPSFQKCEVPLVWWPWWPFNAADVFMGSLLPLERMLREGAISRQVRPMPVLDGFRLPAFYQWWFAPFFERKVCAFGYESITIGLTRYTCPAFAYSTRHPCAQSASAVIQVRY